MTDYCSAESSCGLRYAIQKEPIAVGSNLYLGHSYGTSQQLSFICKKVIVQTQYEWESPKQKQGELENVLHFSDWIDCKPERERFLIYPTFGVSRIPLSDYVRKHGRPDVFPLLIRQLLKGLSHCHQRGVIHGKVDPSTLLIEQLDMEPNPTLILTYDLSREFANPLHEIAPGPYSPPEVWLPEPPLKNGQALYSVDSWACGCVLAYLYTGGHHLFESTGGIESINTKKKSYPSLPVTLPHPERKDLVCPSEVLNLLNGFLAFDPEARLKVTGAYNMVKPKTRSVLAITPEPEDRGPEIVAHFPASVRVGDKFIDVEA